MSAFSNSTMWDIWSSNWCDRCIHDRDGDCPIILAILMDENPPEIKRSGVDYTSVTCDNFVVDLGTTPEVTVEEVSHIPGQYEMEFT